MFFWGFFVLFFFFWKGQLCVKIGATDLSKELPFYLRVHGKSQVHAHICKLFFAVSNTLIDWEKLLSTTQQVGNSSCSLKLAKTELCENIRLLNNQERATRSCLNVFKLQWPHLIGLGRRSKVTTRFARLTVRKGEKCSKIQLKATLKNVSCCWQHLKADSPKDAASFRFHGSTV